jgi:hypothetical protein
VRRGFAALVAFAACNSSTPTLSPDELQDPTTCMQCHSKHYEQWSTSMHAYASTDPVFVAMNKRGQRETNNQLGTFCVQCHAPMAVALKLTDGTDYDPSALTPATNGVTCYFCHDVKTVAGTHNNPLMIALDSTMHGGLQGPVSNDAHHSLYDPVMDSDTNDSSMCGACHDVVTPTISGHGAGNVAIERSFVEWQASAFSSTTPMYHLSCGGCHMPSSTDVIADGSGLDVPLRTNGFHEHDWPAIDQTLPPSGSDLATAIAGILDPSIGIVGPAAAGTQMPTGGICVDPGNGGEISVRMDALTVGHNWPTGASQDRRAWLEVIAYDGSNNVVFSSGVVPAGMDPDSFAAMDPSMFTMWDRMFKADNTPAEFMWDADHEDTTHRLKESVTFDPNSALFDHSSTQVYTGLGAMIPSFDHITARVQIQPYPLALLADLVSSGDLDASLVASVTPLQIQGAMPTWTASLANAVTGCNDNQP